MLKRPSFLFITVLISLIFFALIAFNFSPYLRGPAPYPPDWRWPYEFSFNISRLWAPLGIILLIFKIFKGKEQRFENSNSSIYLFFLIILSFLLQISLLYYGRSGIEVLVHRTINPMISGYFTVSTQILNIGDFIRNFNLNLYDYPMYARFHPPGGILFYYFLEFMLRPLSSIFKDILRINPSHSDVAVVWSGLNSSQRLNALLSGFVIAFIASLTIIPTYLSSKILYGKKVAMRSAALFMFVPSILLFTPLIDVLMPIFTSISLYLFLKGRANKSYLYLFLSGFTLFLGTFFTLTFIPFLFFFFLILFIKFIQKENNLRISIESFISFILGFLIIPFISFFAGINFMETVKTIMIYHEAAQAGRENLIWYFYNIYDFFLFAGIPIGILFFYQTFKAFEILKKTKNFIKIDIIFLSFLIMISIVNISGSVRAETGRIWLPFVPILIIVVANFATNKLKFTNQQFSLLLLLQATQVLIFQSVLVAVW